MSAGSLGLSIDVADGTFGAFIARPETTALAPVVIVLQEIFGVNADIRETCAELARRGYIAIAPDLFWREAPGLDLNSWSPEEWSRGFELYQSFDIDRGVKDIAATVAVARALYGSSGKVGVTGFCLGGLMTYLSAARVAIEGAVGYYGGGIDKHLDEASGIEAPLLLHLAEEDEFISTPAREAIVNAMQDRPLVSVRTYPGCSHAFARHTGAHYDAAAAELANGRTYDFFAQILR